MKNFRTKILDEKPRISSPSEEEYVKWAGKADMASLQQRADMLKTKMQSRKTDSFASIFAVTDLHLLCETRMKDVRQFLRASAVVQFYAVRIEPMDETFFILFWQKAVFLTLWTENMFSQSVLMRKKRAGRSNSPQ